MSGAELLNMSNCHVDGQNGAGRLHLPAALLAASPVYLSGPMSGLPALNFPAFEAAAAALRAGGVVVLSPRELGLEALPNTAEYLEALRACAAQLLQCRSIVLLKGWPRSRGVRLELSMALAFDLPVFYFDPVLGVVDLNLD
jgi:hypothetical protein